MYGIVHAERHASCSRSGCRALGARNSARAARTRSGPSSLMYTRPGLARWPLTAAMPGLTETVQ